MMFRNKLNPLRLIVASLLTLVDNSFFSQKVGYNVFKQLPLIGFLYLISACKPVSEQGLADSLHTLAPLCITSQSQCQIKTELADFTIKFSQPQLADKIKTELPFVIELAELTELAGLAQPQQVTKQNITHISAYLEGKEMFMGKVPVFFEQTDNTGVFIAQSLLASCGDEHMAWRLWLTVELKGQEQTFFVDFISQRQ
ncbi:hypothetical protein MTCD1_02911 [Colwellia marinimaniae]|uniref:Lipoprotein n=1 Tax=Colwellia marinimaniae TaxID=1513592 RepID=A0ABQ0MY68_9GAMM|nr:hypothetical protein MTCD1_02911 [Colwellia marinimaniae]